MTPALPTTDSSSTAGIRSVPTAAAAAAASATAIIAAAALPSTARPPDRLVGAGVAGRAVVYLPGPWVPAHVVRPIVEHGQVSFWC